MDYATLKAFKPSEYEDAADGYRSMGNVAQAAKDRVENTVAAGMRKTLQGEAAEAAQKQLQALAKNFHYIQTECGVISTALNGFAYDMAAAKRKLDTAIGDAQGCTVNEDGSVTYPAGKKPGDEKVADGGTVTGSAGGSPTSDALERQAANIHPNPNYGKAMGYANRIADALKEATDADTKWAPKLQALKADDDLTVSAQDWTDVTSDTGGVREAADAYLDTIKPPPKNDSPQDNANWWNGLSQEQRDAYVSMHPASIGALDGLPSAVRDDANRMVLAEARGAAQVEYDTWLKKHPEPTRHTDYINPMTGTIMKGVKVDSVAWKEWEEARKSAHKSIDGMDAIQNRFDQTGTKGLPEAYLLGFSTEGDGRAILANGNPDTADHQSVYVPGTTAELGTIEGDINRSVNVWNSADAKAGGQSVSTITWLGYDAPDSVPKDAPFEHYAYDGAPALNRFLDGLETSHTGDTAPHRTVIGHSYGTTLVGAAAETGDLNADDVVFAGSPGVKVSGADEMDVPKGHVWNEEAKGDVVPDLGRYGHGGDGLNFRIPSDEKFGANQMTTDTEGHSGYWDEGSTSLKNQALVVVGKGDEVDLKPPPNPLTSEEVMRSK
ncbi:alpha/beta hydrolase [Streptomyces sp. NBC_01481]|uniref:alpha/beta hydrolase n=1 Tax=Streptomyces sp. NBC_01481 TaxID=2975869 RepID=UPI002253AAA9|nr:alpha/beta hydrolase [Streptomyces sp. NBC_01481]MCX4583828.1 alpha/beta hydrolase family protein [Streptomyces sp. NBC_01481]